MPGLIPFAFEILKKSGNAWILPGLQTGLEQAVERSGVAITLGEPPVARAPQQQVQQSDAIFPLFSFLFFAFAAAIPLIVSSCAKQGR